LAAVFPIFSHSSEHLMRSTVLPLAAGLLALGLAVAGSPAAAQGGADAGSGAAAGAGATPAAPAGEAAAAPEAAPEAAPTGPLLVIETAHGTITIQTFPEDAPKTVARITELAEAGFYDGLTFHRVVPGFVVQGGDPTGTGRGGSGKTIPPEFNQRQHVAGTVAMARTQDPNSADSQFYITLAREPHLDGKYTVFGQVIDGMDAVQAIRQGDTMVHVTVRRQEP
jgi:peptidyl-prolyl cis-trans isomerase B (cyclophilin B)